jgi:predicted CXXCH cytochrome family protein
MAFLILRIVLFVFLSVIGLYELVVAEEMECKKCHQDVYDGISAITFKHYNNLLDDCKECHLSIRSSGIKKESKWKRVSLPNYSSEHMAVLKDLTMDSAYKIKVNITDKKGRQKELEPITFTPDAISEFLTDDEILPIINRVEINLIDAPLFAGAEIRFETDKFTDSMIDYGTTKDYGKSINSNSYGKSHIIKLTDIDNNKNYHFVITVTDPFGNRSISENYTFNPAKLSNRRMAGEKQKDDNAKLDFQSMRILKFKPKEGGAKNDMRKAVMQDVIALYFIASSEAASLVEYIKVEDENIAVEEKHGENGLKNQREISVNTCLEKCHRQNTVSHAFNIPIRRNMDVPDEIPLFDGKIITCITCHLPHGSKVKYLARMDFGKLCPICHADR